MEANYVHPDDDPDILAEDNTRPSLPEDFPNFRDFQIEKMVQHFRVVTDGSEQRLRLGFKCKLCNEVFNKTMQLLGHIRKHFEDNHSCRDCGKYFFDTNKLHIHKRAKHTQALKCQLGCPSYTTSNIKCLQSHYLRYHCIKIRPREMKKMEETLVSRSGNTVSKFRIRREEIADQQRALPALPVAQLIEKADTEEPDQETETRTEIDDDDFDEPEDYGQTVECCVCDVYIPSEDDLRVHEETHSSPYVCKICLTAFGLLDDARDHYDAHEKTQVMQNPLQVQSISLSPAILQQQQIQASIPVNTITTQSQQHNPTPNITTMIVMHNGNPILIPVQTFDSSQLVPAFQQQAVPAQINAQPTTTITPITATWPINQLLPVNNQIEIIPIHSTHQVANAPTGTSSSAPALNSIGGGLPIQNIINIKQEHGPPTAAHVQHNAGGGIVITPITALDQNFLQQHQQQAFNAQMQMQQQQQQQHYQPQS
ncbi:ras-responsive element-binding protein 1-like [Wyeomyia smithii]|uniref:ras-responsive element-binding protein 1-like n=1 Tax=Wyeomyia smithii TaxID=174621 RepID=UPI0024680F4A|nr:ras-responsive element-binding protein 1-like [Wyeomyia smithii]